MDIYTSGIGNYGYDNTSNHHASSDPSFEVATKNLATVDYWQPLGVGDIPTLFKRSDVPL